MKREGEKVTSPIMDTEHKWLVIKANEQTRVYERF
jgi:hypothetical protein